MSLQAFTVTIQPKEDSPFNVIPNAPIEIRERLANDTSGSLSLIFSDSAGLSPITQTGATANSLGQFTFYAAAEAYNAVYDNNGTPVTIPVDVGVTAAILNAHIDRLNPDTLAIWQADTSAQAGDVVRLKERATGDSDGATGDVIVGTGTADGFKIVAHSTLNLSWSMRVELYAGAGNTGNYVRTNNISGLNTLGSDYVGLVGKNTIVGTDTASIADEIVSCVVIGVDNMARSTRPQNTVSIGNDCLRNLCYTPADVSNGNVGIGSGAMYVKNKAIGCVAIGLDAFGSFLDAADRITGDLTGVYHSWDGTLNFGGDFVTAVGFNSLGYCYADSNSAFGHNSAAFATSGTFNSFIGASSGTKGAPSGATPADRSFLHGGDFSTFLGAQTGPLEAVKDSTYMTCVGAGTEVGSANTVSLGRAGLDTIVIGKTTAAVNTDTDGSDLQVGRGMTLGNTDQVGTNVLDWYEERVDGTPKTWVPTITGVTFSLANDTTGTYTRVGNRIFYDIKISSTGGATTGLSPQVTNMPGTATHENSAGGHNLSSGNQTRGVVSGVVLFLSGWSVEGGAYVISGSYPV